MEAEKSIIKKNISSSQKSESSGEQKVGNLEISDKEKKEVRKSHERKARVVQRLAERIKNARTLMIVSIKNLPSKQFQEIKKTIREHALIKVAKKNILNRAIKELKKESVLALESNIEENCAFAISDLEGFELARILAKNKTRIFAKAGQIAPEDIEVQAGPTNLIPGPAISELGALGIQISIEEGKISIKAPKVIIKEGGEIKEGAASILQKLDIKPFSIGLKPVTIYDVQTEKIYADINIDFEQSVEDLKGASMKALGLAQKIVYYCKETIGYLLVKANSEGDAFGKFVKIEEPKKETKAEEKPKVEEKPVLSSEQTTKKPISSQEQSGDKSSLSSETVSDNKSESDKKEKEDIQNKSKEEKKDE